MFGCLVSAAHKSSGKTVVSTGLCAALRRRALAVQPFKKGPDYIDPMWLAEAAGRACYNLDPYLSTPDELKRAFARRSAGADAVVVEGNKGLCDGMSLDGRDSSAALARTLGLPVVLVIDARGITRGVAPMLLGLQAFEPGLPFAGVILNRVAGARHESKLRQAIEHYSDVPVLGALGESAALSVTERHLGLVPANEQASAARCIEAFADSLEAAVDLDRLLQRCAVAPLRADPVESRQDRATGAVRGARRGVAVEPLEPLEPVRVAIARDRAFGFYYPEDLEALRAAGAVLVPFDALHAARLPEADALFIGGGFPEVLAASLQANASLRRDIRERIEAGLPAYAECGGLMYLARSISWNGVRFDMVGAIPADVVMHARPVGRGFVHLQETADAPWPGAAPGAELRGHEFHYSSLSDADPGLRYAYRVLRGHGVDGERDGIVHHNLLASYSHLRAVAGNRWPWRFVEFVRSRMAASAPQTGADAAPVPVTP